MQDPRFSFRVSITQLPRDKAIELILTRRSKRTTAIMEALTKKKAPSVKKKDTKVKSSLKGKTPEEIMNSLPRERLLEIIQSLK